MSLFRNPMKGDGNWVTAEKPIDPQNKPEKYIPKILEEIKYGFYADGFFDRRPIVERDMIDGIERGSGKVSKYKGVSLDTTEAAYGGVLIFNPDNNASIFFPAAGRRWHTDGSLEYASETGYYWSSSAAPGWTDTSSGEEKGSAHGNIWGIEYNYTLSPKYYREQNLSLLHLTYQSTPEPLKKTNNTLSHSHIPNYHPYAIFGLRPERK